MRKSYHTRSMVGIRAGISNGDRRIVAGSVMASRTQMLSTLFLAAQAVLGAACAKGEEPDAASNADELDAAPSDGNSVDSADSSIAPSEGGGQEGGESGPPEAGPCNAELTINELQTSGAAGADDEFIELHNPATCSIALDGYALFYRSSDGTDDHMVWSAAAGQGMQPSQFFVLGGKDFTGSADFPMGGAVALGASGGGLGLKKDDTVVDSVGWGDATNDYVEAAAAIAPPSGKSIGRFPDGSDTDSNAADFAELTSSPRKTNNAW